MERKQVPSKLDKHIDDFYEESDVNEKFSDQWVNQDSSNHDNLEPGNMNNENVYEGSVDSNQDQETEIDEENIESDQDPHTMLDDLI